MLYWLWAIILIFYVKGLYPSLHSNSFQVHFSLQGRPDFQGHKSNQFSKDKFSLKKKFINSKVKY